MTLDNAFANDAPQNTLKSQLLLQNGLICGGEFYHVRCCTHIKFNCSRRIKGVW